MSADLARAASVRFPTFEDAAKIGLLIAAGLASAPSAPIDRDELGSDLEQVGRDFVSAHVFGNETLILAEVGRHAAGIARIVPREFHRAAHVGTVQILVAPLHRQRGVGRLLLETALAEGFQRRGYARIEMPVASHDPGTQHLLRSPRWQIERVERGALRMHGDLYDVAIWVTDSTGPTRATEPSG